MKRGYMCESVRGQEAMTDRGGGRGLYSSFASSQGGRLKSRRQLGRQRAPQGGGGGDNAGTDTHTQPAFWAWRGDEGTTEVRTRPPTLRTCVEVLRQIRQTMPDGVQQSQASKPVTMTGRCDRVRRSIFRSVTNPNSNRSIVPKVTRSPSRHRNCPILSALVHVWYEYSP